MVAAAPAAAAAAAAAAVLGAAAADTAATSSYRPVSWWKTGTPQSVYSVIWGNYMTGMLGRTVHQLTYIRQ